jgi:hypothetical protein
MTDLESEQPLQVPARRMSAQDVLDMHADLQRTMSHLQPRLRARLLEYAVEDVAGHPEWSASHLHPAKTWRDLEPWLASLGTDLFGARTYQVTAEMVELAEKLEPATPNLSELVEADMPHPWGFMWFDKPVPIISVDDNGRPPLLMQAVSWAMVPRLNVDLGGTDFTMTMPAVRVRKWGYNEDPRFDPRPLYLMGQQTVPVGNSIHTTVEDMRLLHMIWIMIGMEIVTSDPEVVGRQGRKRAANLRYRQVHVVRLRRAKRGEEPEGEHRHVDWACSWLVRGHWRKAPHGGRFKNGSAKTWVKAHIKGPDGKPLRASDLLYRLQR